MIQKKLSSILVNIFVCVDQLFPIDNKLIHDDENTNKAGSTFVSVPLKAKKMRQLFSLRNSQFNSTEKTQRATLHCLEAFLLLFSSEISKPQAFFSTRTVNYIT